MGRDRPARVDDGGRVQRATAALARYAARKGTERGLQALLARGAGATAKAAAAHPHAAVGVAGVAAVAAVAILFVLIAALAVFGFAGAASGACSGRQPPPTGRIVADARGDPPRNLIPWLIRAANQPSAQLGPRGPAVLAAIAKTESDFGRSPLDGISSGVNFRGCCAGPFQFNLRDTWDGYKDDPGADADGDGTVDVYSFPDAAYAAARKLASQGAPEDWNTALFKYNPSTSYVEDVSRLANTYQGLIDAAPDGPVTADPVRAESCIERTGGGGGGGGGGALGEPLGELPADTLARVYRIADWIEAQRFRYCYGGGHDPRPGPDGGNQYCYNNDRERISGSLTGLDCSGSVRWLLVLAGYPDPGGIVSGQFLGTYPRGPGKHVTIWSNNVHVFVTIDGRAWGTSRSNYAHGPGWVPGYPTAGFSPSHPPGL